MAGLIRITSFGINDPKQARPSAAITIDCRNLPNPHQIPGLRPRDGLNRLVATWLMEQDGVPEFIDAQAERVTRAAATTVAVGCSAGRHRAVMVAEQLAHRLREGGAQVMVEHLGIKRKPKKAKTSTEKGLGWDHQQNRERLIRSHRDGAKCWWCGMPMFKDKARNPDRLALDADHSKARSKGGTKADRLLHGSCNRSRGDGSRDHLRPTAPALATATPITTRQWF